MTGGRQWSRSDLDQEKNNGLRNNVFIPPGFHYLHIMDYKCFQYLVWKWIYRAQFTFMNISEMYSDVCSTIPLLGLIKTLLAFFWDSLHHESYWVHIRKRKTSNKYIDSSAAGLLSFITSLQISNTTTLLQTFLRALSIDRAQYWHFANGEYLKLIPSFNFSGLFLSPHQLFCLHHHGTWSTGALLCSSFLLVLSLVLKVAQKLS